MSTVTPAPVDPGPSVPPKLRTGVYYTSLAVGALVTLVVGVVAALAPEAAPKVLAVCGAVTATTTFVVGGIASAFRPASLRSAPTGPAVIDGDTWGDGTPVSAGGPVIGG